jgi:ABC-type polysaccharide/polyol phosphate export permease
MTRKSAHVKTEKDCLWSKENINLLKELTISNFKLRNEGSILGVLWYLINPLLMLIVLYLVFSKSIGSGIENYALYVLIGVIQWNFFSSSTIEGMLSIETYALMIRKVNFPKEILVISAVCNIFLSHLIEWIIFLIFLGVIMGFSKAIILLPLIIIVQIILSIAVALLLGVLLSYYRDIKNIWRNLLLVCWFLTPIFYLKEMVPKELIFINNVNPMTWIINFSRTILLEGKISNLWNIIILLILVSTLLGISFFVFKKLAVNMAERV